MIWQKELENAACSVEDIEKYLQLTDEEKDVIQKVSDVHPMRITRYYMSLIDSSNPEDPIRKLAIPGAHELDTSGQYDTSGEKKNTKFPGLQHKYNETALLLVTNHCPTYCRHCFRKRMVGMSDTEILKRFYNALDYLKGTKQITNVLITGGDPFILSNNVIRELLQKLVTIDHLQYIRFGTRTPVTFPDRILGDREFVKMLRSFSKIKKIHISTHFNHPREVTYEARKALELLRVPVNNQTVLLRGVNDNVDTLVELMNKLVAAGIVPYYVFQCRPTARVKKGFQIPLFKGLKIIEETRARLGGYAKRFRYVMSHETGKIEIVGIEEDCFLFRYHQAKNAGDINRLFKKGIRLHAGWLDDL